MADLGKFLDKDMAIDEAHLRRSLEDQFDMAVESAIENMMDQEEQQFQKGQEPVLDATIERAKESSSSPIDEEINAAFIEEQNRLLAYCARASEKPVFT